MLVFTGGIGEHSKPVRARIAQLAAWQGIDIDLEANDNSALHLNTPQSKVEVLVIPTNEEWMIARQTQSLLKL